jgi:hypothetical protein
LFENTSIASAVTPKKRVDVERITSAHVSRRSSSRLLRRKRKNTRYAASSPASVAAVSIAV